MAADWRGVTRAVLFNHVNDKQINFGMCQICVLLLCYHVTSLNIWNILLLQIHLFDYGTPIEETVSVLNDLVHCGKVRYIGLSNMKGWQLQKYVEISKQKGYESIVALQVNIVNL